MTDEQFVDMVKKYMPEIAAAEFTNELYPSREVLTDLSSLFDYVLELKEQVKEAQHKPRGTALLTPLNNVNACAAVGPTQFMNNQVTEHIICSCGDIYPKGTEHKHT